MILDFEKVATIVDLEAHYPESWDAYRAELERQAQAAVDAGKRRGFVDGFVACAKQRFFDRTGFTAFASEVDDFELEALGRWERLVALKARFGEDE